MKIRRPLAVVSTGLCIAAVGGDAAAAIGLDVYASTAGGESQLGAVGGGFSCSTFAPDARALRYHGGYLFSLPTDGPGCGVGSDIHFAEAATGPIAVTAAFGPASFGGAGDTKTFVGAAAARAAYGVLGVSSSASYDGTTNAFVADGSGAGALQTESFTFSGATGGGLFRATFTLDGTLLTTGRTDNQIQFSYAVDGGPVFSVFRLQDSRGDVTLLTPAGYVPSLPGITVGGSNASGQTIGGRTSFQVDVPMVWGQPFEFTTMLWAGTLPSSSVGQPGPSSGSASFLTTLRLTGIEIFDSSGHPVPGFGVTAGSGTPYGPAGVVPEPGSAVLLLAGLGALVLRRFWRD